MMDHPQPRKYLIRSHATQPISLDLNEFYLGVRFDAEFHRRFAELINRVAGLSKLATKLPATRRAL
jgi:hypothetical protein